MGRIFPSIMPEHEQFMKKQHLFFVATAGREGRVNLSPKGYDTFRMLSPNQVAYLDLTGSGNETSAHLTDSNRITFMFISFEENPLILRLYGCGRVVLPKDEAWGELMRHFRPLPGMRQIIVADIDMVQTSCGFGVPLYRYEGRRNTLLEWAEKQGTSGLEDYWKRKNSVSLDGIRTPIGLSLDVREDRQRDGLTP